MQNEQMQLVVSSGAHVLNVIGQTDRDRQTDRHTASCRGGEYSIPGVSLAIHVE